MITFKKVSKQYEDGTVALYPMHLQIEKGEFFVLVGPSGCGKTTTLKMINRLIEPSNGIIEVNGKEIADMPTHELRRGIGYVLQQIALFPHMTVEQNIAVTPELSDWDRKRIDSRINELLHMVNLDPEVFRSRKPDELSGGQQQRIGVLRALAADPPVILMDEPFSALDPIARERLQNDLLELQARIHKTIVFVTHDIQEALKLGDRIGVMREGKLVQIDTPQQLLEQPADEFVRDFFRTGIADQISSTLKQPNAGEMQKPTALLTADRKGREL